MPLFSRAAQKGTITADEAFVYIEADFDAKIIGTVRRGEVFDISDNTKGPFYKIRLKDSRLGWISSVDIKPGKKILSTKKAEPLKAYQEEKKEENRFIRWRWQGPRFELLEWKEKTLGRIRKESMHLYGWSWTGMDTFWQGPFYMDSSVTAAFQAPQYYKKVTGVAAKGWLVKMQTALLSPKPIGENFLFFYGLGPVIDYSHFEAGVLQSGKPVRYNLDDLSLGLAVPIGFAYRVGHISFQGWYRFYWQKQTTSSFSLGIGFDF